MQYFARILMLTMVLIINGNVFSQTINTGRFHKVIISPYIEAAFIEGNEEQVVVNRSAVDADKLNVETNNGTLRIYLDGAKEIPRNTRENREHGHNRDLYPKSAVSVTIYYRHLNALSLRGEESFACKSPLSTKSFDLKLYGESAITFTEVDFGEMHTVIYGESSIHIQSGNIDKQSYTCYGEGKVNATEITSEEAKLTSYGEANFRMNVSGRIRISSFGESRLRYKGNAQIVKGINVGGVDVARLD